MKKEIKKISTVFAVAFVVFNAVVFAVPNQVFGVKRFENTTFWVSYAFTVLLFVADVIAAIKTAVEGSVKTLFNLTKTASACIAISVTAAVGAAVLALPIVPAYVSAIVGAAATAYLIVALTKKEAKEQDGAPNIKFITLLIADAEVLQDRAVTEEGRAIAKKAYEAIRYSDPVSADELNDLERQIQDKYGALKAALSAGADNCGQIADELLLLIKERNAKCKVLK